MKTKDKIQLSFEIISAKTVIIIIKRSYELETQPGIIERRYSDFSKFFNSLKKTYPYYLEDFPFPKKIYSRNFLPEVITERSIAFQHLLSYCLRVKEIRESKEFLEFLLHLEFKESRSLLRNKCFEEAVIYLENLYFIINKLYQLDNTDYLKINLFTTICALAACLNEIEKFEESLNFADKAFDLIRNSSFFHLNDLIVPFLLLSVQLNSRLSKCCLEQNKKLLELNEKGINYDKKESLMELFILNNYFKINP